MKPFNEKPPPSTTPPPSSPQRVLLIDEDAKDLRNFATQLGRMGCSVRAFADYREAVECLKGGYFDLVIVSQDSLAHETHRLAEFTIGRDRYTPVVVLTRCLDINRYLEAMQHGATDYLVKPLTAEELERAITTHCQPRHGEVSSSAS